MTKEFKETQEKIKLNLENKGFYVEIHNNSIDFTDSWAMGCYAHITKDEIENAIGRV
jgi:hypothetical protein